METYINTHKIWLSHKLTFLFKKGNYSVKKVKGKAIPVTGCEGP
jgi:hypothetical protein